MSCQTEACVCNQLPAPHYLWAGITPQQKIDATLTINTNCSLLCGLTCGKNPGLSGMQHDIFRKGKDRGLGRKENGYKESSQAEF